MKIQHCLVVFAICSFLAGCALVPSVDWSNPSETTSRVRVTKDDFKNNIAFIGPDISTEYLDDLLILAWKNYDSPTVRFQIYWKDHYTTLKGCWFYNHAYDSDGNNIDLTMISRDVIDVNGSAVTFEESIGLNIDRAYLDKKKNTGIQIRIYGEKWNNTISIPSGYIKGFLAAVDQYK